MTRWKWSHEMQITVNMPDAFIAKVAKRDFAVGDVADWPQVSKDKVFAYGLQRIFNDAGAGGKSADESVALATKRLTNLQGGVLRASPVREGDPVKREAFKLATAKVFDAIKSAGKKKLAEYKTSEIRTLAERYLEKYPNTFEIARANVELASEMSVDIDIDLDTADVDESDDEEVDESDEEELDTDE